MDVVMVLTYVNRIWSRIVKLTPDYFTVLASFNTPSEFQEDHFNTGTSKIYYFNVGLFSYIVQFNRVGVEGYKNVWSLGFILNDFRGSLQDMQEYLQGVYKREVSLEDAEAVYYEIKGGGSSGDINIKQEKAVFSSLFEIIRKFVKTEKPNCLWFSGTSDKKFRVYETMVKKFMSDWIPEINRNGNMLVCQKGPS
jgi:hypothetical protein